MPKETLYSTEPFGKDEAETVTLGLDLRWGRDTDYFQIATVIEDAEGAPITREARGGWYVSLDRHQINELIRKLRRARDQAFGRDE